ncbi:MAG: heavy metal-binding domain-containing protein [Acidobacteriota bacterium]|nr:heavy metal-binding domain-containing protein [Acidobacteriota bacterium]
MITTAETLIGFEIVQLMGTVEGVIELGFSAVSVGGVGVVNGGGLENMLFEAKQLLAQMASQRGANAVIGFRYALTGRNLEKSVVAYGTAVNVKKVERTST